MHPAASLVAFTTLSGLGLGLLGFLGLGVPAVSGWTAFAFYALGFGLTGAGLLASTLHLGHPERMLLAFREWRSSWLSREAWAAVVTLAVMGVYALTHLAGLRLAPLGWIGAALCAVTVFCTAMIYTQLRTVPRWHHWTTPALFLAHAVTGGALLAGQVTLAAILLIVTGFAQFLGWRMADARVAAQAGTAGTATGLGDRGRVRAFSPPHTGDSYLTREMVFVVARKHALKLRTISLVLGYALPVVLLALPFSHLAAALAVLFHAGGVAVGRWLFFAEAEHVVGLYYGRPGFGGA